MTVKTSQVAHLLPGVKVCYFSNSSLAILHYACFTLTNVHALNVLFAIPHSGEIHLREVTY